MVELTPEQEKNFANFPVVAHLAVEEKPQLNAAEQQALHKAQLQASELMVMKAALLEATASRGWPYILKFAETIVRNMEQEAIAEEDDVKANGLRRDARGARKFKDELIRRISLAKGQEPEQFLEVIS